MNFYVIAKEKGVDTLIFFHFVILLIDIFFMQKKKSNKTIDLIFVFYQVIIISSYSVLAFCLK